MDLSNYSTKSILWWLKKISHWKNEDESGGAPIEEFVRMKPKMYSFLVDNNSDHEKARGVNRKVAAT